MLKSLYKFIPYCVLAVLMGCATNDNRQGVAEEPYEVPRDSAEIEKLKVPRHLKQQILQLQNDDPVERAWAAYRLAKTGQGAAPAIPYLIDLLNDNTPVLLSRYLGAGFRSSSDTTPAMEAAYALGKIGYPANEALAVAARHPSAQVRRMAIKAIGQVGDIGSIDLLLASLQDTDRRVHVAAAIALGNYRHPLAVQKLMQAFENSSPKVRADISYAFAQINDILAVPFLINHLPRQQPEVRAAMVLALGKLRDARAVDVLIKSRQDSDIMVRTNAVYALGSFYQPKVMDVLIGALADKAPQVRAGAADSLNKLTGINLGDGQQRWLKWWRQQKRAMQNKK